MKSVTEWTAPEGRLSGNFLVEILKMAGVDTPVNTQKVPIRRRSLIEVGGEGGSGGGKPPRIPQRSPKPRQGSWRQNRELLL